jgi:hypothetical protein
VDALGCATLVASSNIKSNGSLITTGITMNQLGALAFLDYFTGGVTRLLARGPDASTDGSLSIITTRSDGSNVLTPISIDASGSIFIASGNDLRMSAVDDVVITGLGTYADNAAAIAGGVPVGGLYIASSGDPRPVCIRV